MSNLTNYLPLTLSTILFLGACQTTADILPPMVGERTSQAQDVLKQMAWAEPHTTFTMSVGDSHEMDEIITGIPYTSARGRQCIPLLDLQKNPIGQLICEKSSGEWYLQQTLSIKNFEVLENM